MNKLNLIRNNLLAKGVLDAQLNALLVEFDKEYTSALANASKVPALEQRIEELEALTMILRGSSPVEEQPSEPTQPDNENNDDSGADPNAEGVDPVEALDAAESKVLEGVNFSK
jgi:hypothetical protein